MPRNLNRTLADNELQIIGIEFTVQTYEHGTQELAMFSPTGLIIPRLRSGGIGDMYLPAITFHYTDGDYTMGGNQHGYYADCPW